MSAERYSAVAMNAVRPGEEDSRLLELIARADSVNRGSQSLSMANREIDPEMGVHIGSLVTRDQSIHMGALRGSTQRTRRMEMEGRDQDIQFNMFDNANDAPPTQFDDRTLAEHANGHRTSRFAKQRSRFVNKGAAPAAVRASRATTRATPQQQLLEESLASKDPQSVAKAFGLLSSLNKNSVGDVKQMDVDNFLDAGAHASRANSKVLKSFGMAEEDSIARSGGGAKRASAARAGVDQQGGSRCSRSGSYSQFGNADPMTWILILLLVMCLVAACSYLIYMSCADPMYVRYSEGGQQQVLRGGGIGDWWQSVKQKAAQLYSSKAAPKVAALREGAGKAASALKQGAYNAGASVKQGIQNLRGSSPSMLPSTFEGGGKFDVSHEGRKVTEDTIGRLLRALDE